ncbi:MAG: universal stress protein [Roseivivax sp.]|nr:universal stress protein [Roseivivax sp.]
MAYKSLLTVVTDPDLASETLAHAAKMAQSLDAHLDVQTLGVDRTQTGYYYAGANAMVLQETLNRATEEANSLAEKARAFLNHEDVRWNIETGVVQLADVGRYVASRARFCDLTLLPLPYGKSRGVEMEPVVEGALFDGNCPVMVVPEKIEPVSTPQRIVVGWNESTEALRAVRAALPLLIGADVVHIVVIDPPQHGPNRSDPGGQLSQFLSRHGVSCEVDVLSKTMPRVADVLMRHVSDVNADMMVMGAYGHSRFREAILGGATRNMLEQAPVPVFMAH